MRTSVFFSNESDFFSTKKIGKIKKLHSTSSGKVSVSSYCYALQKALTFQEP